MAQKTVVLDHYYNNEVNPKTNKPFHYLWEDKEISGFSQLGDLFIEQGATLKTLANKPDKKNLRDADIYIIADPDTKDESTNPNYMDKDAAKAIAAWVKKGGTLLLLTNDYQNAELEHTNILAKKFGITFTKEILHTELSESGKPRNFNSCASTNLPPQPLFSGVSKIFIKGVSAITYNPPVTPLLVENGKTLMAQVNYGKGLVIAIGDPWLYNEYIDNKILPAEFENLKAAKNLVKLVMEQ